MNQSKRESLSLESESQKKTKYDTSETEDKFIQEIRKDESLFKESFRKIKSVLNLQLSLVQNMIKNPIFKHLKLKLLPEVEGVLNDLEDSESSLLFNANIRVPGDIDIRSLFADSVEMNLLLSKFLVGLYTDISNPDDMVFLFFFNFLIRLQSSTIFVEPIVFLRSFI
jgi:hypothetical protein